MSFASEYATWVLAPENKDRTGEYIKAAARRFFSDMKRTDIYFDEVEGSRIIEFTEENLFHWEDKWRGTRIKLELWQKFIFQQVYGWKVVSTGLRRIRTVFVEIAKKNAKTTMCAIMAIFHLFADDINSPKVFVGANNHEQANLCVHCAGKIIEESPNLAEYLDDKSVTLSKYNGDIYKVSHNERDGFIKAVPKEPEKQTAKQAGGKHGINPSFVVVDEYAMADSDSLLNAMENAQGAREQPLMACITTAGHKKAGPCFQKLRATGIKVTQGIIEDDAYIAFIFEMDKPVGTDGKSKEIDIQYLIDHPEVWGQANPNHKVSVFDEFLRGQLTKAANEGGSKTVDVQTFNFNIWVDSADSFIPPEIWDRNRHGIDEDDLLGQSCYGGIEFVSGMMLNAFCFVFPDIGGKKVVKPVFWMPEDIRRDEDQFDTWIKEGLIHIDIGNVFDNEKALDILVGEAQKYMMHSFAFKKSMEHSDIVQGLIKLGYTGNPISHGMQGISTPTLAWEEMLSSGEVEHFGNPVLAWMNSNCLVKRRDNEIRLEKSGSRVVGIYAAINAIAQMKTIEATGGNAELGIIVL